MPVTTQHKSYNDAHEQWQRNRDATSGQKAIKEGGTRYLPDFEPEDIHRYRKYKKRARFLNVTGRTKNALVGAVFRQEPEIDVPDTLEYVTENVDGAGEGVSQISKRLVDDILQTGRYGLLVDYPPAPEGLTDEQVAALDLKPYVAPYTAEAIINWDTMVLAGRQILSLVVLKEDAAIQVDEFERRTEDRYRVLRLDESLRYYQQVYDRYGEPVTDPQYARGYNGDMLTRIPFVFVGAQDNKPKIDEAPLTDLAETNISWYQVSADHMENLHIHGQLTLGVASSMGVEQFQAANPNGVVVGARTGHFLGEGGQFTTATAPESSSLSKALEDIKDDMVAIGGRLIQPRTGQRTAEEARLEASSEMSVLDTVVGNVSDGMRTVLRWMAEFIGADPETITFELNRQFWDMSPDPQLITALMGLESRGHIAPSDVRSYTRKVGIVDSDRTDEEIDEEASQDAGVVPQLGGVSRG